MSISNDSVGKLFINCNGQVAVHESYCASPTATLKHVLSGQKVGGAVGCLLLSKFEPLDYENEDHQEHITALLKLGLIESTQ